MAKKDMKMKINIEGDSSGLRRSLQQSGRDLQQFQKRSGVGGGGGIGNIAQLGTAALQLKSMGQLKKLSSMMQNAGPGMGMQGFGNVAPFKMSMRYMFFHLKESINAMRSMEHDPARMYGNAKHAANIGIGMVHRTMPAVLGALAGGAATAALAAAAFGVMRKVGAQSATNIKDATQFSPMIQALGAEFELKELRHQMEVARNPFLMNQQRRLKQSEFDRKYGGGVGSGYVATELEITINELVTGLKEAYAYMTGADAITEKGVAY